MAQTRRVAVTARYLGFTIEIHNARQVTIRDPSGTALARWATMNDATARAFIRGYRREERSATSDPACT